MKTRNVVFTTTFLAFGVLALCSIAQAVSPAPDGGYPGGNTAEGQSALLSLTTGRFNTAVGFLSLRSDRTGQLNTAVGAGALLANTADNNTATGAGALLSNSTGTANTANGAFALTYNSTGSFNTANGVSALINNTTGSFNTATGIGALQENSTGSNNIGLGNAAGLNVSGANNVICIGAGVAGADVSNTTWIGNIYNTTTLSGTTLPVIVSDQGQLGTTPSSRRFKQEIKPMNSTSESILALKPVTFYYKSDAKNTPCFGLIAEEVADVNPDLVVRDKNGEIYTVRYDAVNAMLLNEFLKEHKKVQNLEATVAQQQKGMEILTAQLKEQAAQTQRVRAQVEVKKKAQQVVATNP